MTKGHFLLTVAAAAVLAACAPVAGTADGIANTRADTREGRLANQDRDRLRGDADTVAEILQRGMEAEARGDGDALLAQAQALALMGAKPQDGAPDLARQWAATAKSLGARPSTAVAFRGRTLGPGYRSGKVSANGAFRTRQTYNAGQRAEIVLVPVDAEPLSLEVRDDEGEPVCAVAPSTRNLGCRWVPAFTGSNEIEVRNDNAVTVNFYIVLN